MPGSPARAERLLDAFLTGDLSKFLALGILTVLSRLHEHIEQDVDHQRHVSRGPENEENNSHNKMLGDFSASWWVALETSAPPRREEAKGNKRLESEDNPRGWLRRVCGHI